MSREQLRVIVPMCADFLHPGHINLLQAAAAEGQVTVLLMTDEAMTAYKRKPYFCYSDREKIVRTRDASAIDLHVFFAERNDAVAVVRTLRSSKQRIGMLDWRAAFLSPCNGD